MKYSPTKSLDRMAGSNNFPGEEALTWQGMCRASGSVIHRTADGRAQDIDYRIDGGTMHQKIGAENYTFRRIITEPGGPANGSQPFRSD